MRPIEEVPGESQLAQVERSPGCRVCCSVRTTVRLALHMAVLTGIRCNPVLQAFCQRLRAVGKLKNTVLVHCM
jgi:hypothetical protein